MIGDPGDGGPCNAITGTRPDAGTRSAIGDRSRPHRRRAHDAPLGARKLGTVECPILFEAPEAGDLIGSFVGAVSGGALYRKSSFLLDSLGTQVFAPHISLREEPHMLRGRGSAPFDNEGVATAPRDVVRDGIVRGYFLGSYSARKLGMTTTGNACQRSLVSSRMAARSRRAHAQMGRGSSSPNNWARASTGYRQLLAAPAGFWVEGGEIMPGRGRSHDRRQPQGHLPRHRGDRMRRRSARIAAHRIRPGRPDDGRRGIDRAHGARFAACTSRSSRGSGHSETRCETRKRRRNGSRRCRLTDAMAIRRKRSARHEVSPERAGSRVRHRPSAAAHRRPARAVSSQLSAQSHTANYQKARGRDAAVARRLRPGQGVRGGL